VGLFNDAAAQQPTTIARDRYTFNLEKDQFTPPVRVTATGIHIQVNGSADCEVEVEKALRFGRMRTFRKAAAAESFEIDHFVDNLQSAIGLTVEPKRAWLLASIDRTVYTAVSNQLSDWQKNISLCVSLASKVLYNGMNISDIAEFLNAKKGVKVRLTIAGVSFNYALASAGINITTPCAFFNLNYVSTEPTTLTQLQDISPAGPQYVPEDVADFRGLSATGRAAIFRTNASVYPGYSDDASYIQIFFPRNYTSQAAFNANWTANNAKINEILNWRYYTANRSAGVVFSLPLVMRFEFGGDSLEDEAIDVDISTWHKVGEWSATGARRFWSYGYEKLGRAKQFFRVRCKAGTADVRVVL